MYSHELYLHVPEETLFSLIIKCSLMFELFFIFLFFSFVFFFFLM